MIRLWDAIIGNVLREFLANHGGAACVALAQDGKRLAAGSSDGRIHLWDPENGSPRGELPGHAGGVTCLAFGLDGQVLASGGRDAIVRLWDLPRLKELKKFAGHAGPIMAVAFTARGDRLATGGEDMGIRLWDTVSGQEKGLFRGHGGAVTALAFSPDGRLLASGGWDRSARLWDLEAGESRELTGLGGGVRAVMFTPDGRELFIGGGKAVRSWDPTNGRSRRPVATLGAAVLAAALTPDGTTLAVGGADGLIRLFDPITGTEQRHLEGHRGPVVALTYGPGGRLLASASTGASVATRPRRLATEPVAAAPPRTADPDRLWADLAGDVRAALAAQRLLGADPEAAVALVRDRLKPAEKGPSPSSTEMLRGLRAVDLLARVGSPEARAVLEALAGGVPEAAVTDAALAALARLGP
jgi:WD40 repeat protein